MTIKEIEKMAAEKFPTANASNFGVILARFQQEGYIAGYKAAAIKTKRLSEQAEIVKQRLHYHFGKVGGGWNIPDNMPFMNEFLNEVEKLANPTPSPTTTDK